jgi:transposase-like protein
MSHRVDSLFKISQWFIHPFDFLLHMTNTRIARIQELIKLEEQRSRIEDDINSLVERMGSLRDSLFEASTSSEARVSAPASSTAKAPRRSGRTPRGELKTQMMAALKAAGGNTVRVADLAKSLGLNPTNVHAWFHSAMKRYPQIKKVGRGEFRVTGALPNGDKSNGTAPRASVRVAGPRKSTAPKGKRGELKEAILDTLSKAGAAGITVKDIAEKVGVPYKNVFIWFATTGKKNPKVKKVAPATFKLAA